MNKYLILSIILLSGVLAINLDAQEKRFFVPSEISKTYEKGTRAYDGRPGENYWQNTVDYNIDVEINIAEKLIEGHEEVVYYNNSPDDISQLVVRLYKDVYKKGKTRSYALNERDIGEGVELDNVVINDVEYDLDDRRMVQRRGTNIIFNLQEPLAPGSKLTFKTNWKQTIPEFSDARTKAFDSTTFFVAYWYPQISVYDDIFGWDKLDNNVMTEYYNNLANFDVTITVPDNFIVWATGTLENADEVLPGKLYDKYQRAHTSEDVIHIVSSDDLEKGIKVLNNAWNYRATEVSDFAFALSDHYIWEAASQSVDGRQVFISSAHAADSTRDFSDHVPIQQKTMKHFSEDIPGVPYPYEAFTTFVARSGGGMEYPMMANNGSPRRGVTVHEMFHTYFPMYVRTNERVWAWMDEGWAVYNTGIVSNRFFSNDAEFASLFSESNSRGRSGTIADLPLITSSEFLSSMNYGYASYSTGAFIYTILHHHMGDELFLKCYREYISRWAKKAPSPYDFFYTFEDVSRQDLGWLWKPWLFEFGVPDLAIESFKKDRLRVSKVGHKPVPIFLNVKYENGSSEIISRSAGVWASGENEFEVIIPNYQDVKEIFLNEMIRDENPLDNLYPSVKSRYEGMNISDGMQGRYETEGGFRINVTIEEGLINLRIPRGGMDLILYPLAPDRFRSIDGSMEVEFIENDSGSITGMGLDWYRYIHAEKID